MPLNFILNDEFYINLNEICIRNELIKIFKVFFKIFHKNGQIKSSTINKLGEVIESFKKMKK